MATREARILHTSIDVPFADAYAFAHRPENFPQWAAGLSGSLTRTERGWTTPSPDGDVVIRFTEPNAHGVVDHWVTIPGKPENYMPMRLFANGDGTEVEIALVRIAGMDDAAFGQDAAAIERDLASLKRVLESRR